MLIVISGLPGVGKTTVADLVGARIGAVRLSIDPVEDALIAAGLPRGWETGVAAYEAVGALAELNLQAGLTVVVDAVNDSGPARDTWSRAATSAGAALCWVVLTMSDSASHASRLDGRDRGFSHIPEPTWTEVSGRAMEAWVGPHRAIDVSQSAVEQVAAEVEQYAAELSRERRGFESRSARDDRDDRRAEGVMTAIDVRGRLICRTDEEAAIVLRELPRHIALTRAEPGCVHFVVERTDDPHVWSVSERFVDREAFDAHQERVQASEWGRATWGIHRDYVVETHPHSTQGRDA